MCSPSEIAEKMRYKVRDFGHYFEVPYTAAPIYTLRLPHPLVTAKTFIVWLPDSSLLDPAKWELDQRNGIVKFQDPNDIPDGVGCSGYFYEWFLDEDLEYAASVVSNQHLYDRSGMDSAEFSPVECDIIATGGVAQAWSSLMTELALDIDVSTPEGMSIPASERFRQASGMVEFWSQQYKDEAALIGVGLARIEQFWLRRVAYMTNRLVPLMREREIDDPRPPVRLLPPIPAGVMESDGENTEVTMPEPPGGLGYGGWQTQGTSGT